jgi:hypothetical protein
MYTAQADLSSNPIEIDLTDGVLKIILMLS